MKTGRGWVSMKTGQKGQAKVIGPNIGPNISPLPNPFSGSLRSPRSLRSPPPRRGIEKISVAVDIGGDVIGKVRRTGRKRTLSAH
jgi:hypothetical protein